MRFRFWFGICRTHYAGVLVWRGAWHEAEAELLESTKDLEASRPSHAAEGLVRLAELRRRQGRLDEAVALFAQAEGHPLAMLGNAELALERGEPKEAESLLQRFLRWMPEENKTLRAPAYELLVRTEIALGDDVQAQAAFESLRSIATAVATQLLLAAASFAEGMLAVARGDYQTAGYRFEDAIERFQRSGTPYEANRARIELVHVLYALDRVSIAQKEARSALDALQSIGAQREAERVAQLLQWLETPQHTSPAPTFADLSSIPTPEADSTAPSLITRREAEVLQLVAQGFGDREIATRLTISAHTVHRHIANIMTKLDVATRAAAVSTAAKLGLV
jgi:LuxR family transcriptional regulator, maltose regulon positive regulatory protein